MKKNTSVSLGDLIEEKEKRVISLKKAILEGTESGVAVDFHPEKHLGFLKARNKSMSKHRLIRTATST